VKEITAEIEIDAPAEKVWQVLIDFERYPEWNPSITRIGGDKRAGGRLEFEGAMGGSRTMRFRPRVLVYEPNRELRWLGQLFLPGLFDGEHGFEIEPLGEGRSRFRQSERFRGLLVAPIWALIGTDTRRGFEAMNQALKARAEGS
jgi:hypothetical protein